MTFTCFSTKLFMMIIGDRPAYESPIMATCGPVLSWTVETNDPCRPASSVSVRSTALRYSELASGEVRKDTLTSEPGIFHYTRYNMLKLVQTWEAWISLQFRFRCEPRHPGIHWSPVSVGSTETAHVGLAGKRVEKAHLTSNGHVNAKLHAQSCFYTIYIWHSLMLPYVCIFRM